MKAPRKLWVKLGVLATMLLLAIGAAALPLVFTDALVTNFLRVLELVARLS